ncbi:hypothetical protein MENTO_v1c01700 [Mesoplasma entomophilum]|uniref:Uncharacterized protein n=1 Tax=Mesoplasma coleopterae TaxID=324078 RepID=A0A2K8P1Z3_9MOLU|nr:hypothetical protein MENTO_v1c01700 [Mesoplasma entomophilum]ATZ20696.1 hypothetical protein MCOLE_v1c01820 [Mesoplasma coleopterae]
MTINEILDLQINTEKETPVFASEAIIQITIICKA